MYGYIYLTTNLVNNKKYIGKHKAESWDELYKGSGNILLQAIAKDGVENFQCQILEPVNNVPTVCESLDELNASEEYYIDYYNCVESNNYYNLKRGGDGGGVAGTRYMTNGFDNKLVCAQDVNKLQAEGYYFGGPKQSEELKQRRGQAHKGLKYQHSEEFLQNGSKNRGRKVSDEHKRKLSEAHRGKTTSRKGKIQVTLNGTNPKYILPEELEKYESLGYKHIGVKWNYKNN